MEVYELDQIPQPGRRRFLKAGLYFFKGLAVAASLVSTVCGMMLLYALWSAAGTLAPTDMIFVAALACLGIYVGFSTVRDMKTKEKSIEGWVLYSALTVAVAAAFVGLLMRNISLSLT